MLSNICMAAPPTEDGAVTLFSTAFYINSGKTATRFHDTALHCTLHNPTAILIGKNRRCAIERNLAFLPIAAYAILNHTSGENREATLLTVIDISQEVFSCQVYPGDPTPEKSTLSGIADGGVCNLTSLSMCAHNGTHVDAPYHFVEDGKRIDELDVSVFVGDAYVARHEGTVTAADAQGVLDRAAAENAAERILIAGRATVTAEAACVFADAGIRLLGNESQTVGPEDAPMEVHLILLGAGVVLLEGVRLGSVSEGKYLLSAAPLNLGGCDGAPCRAVLIR